MCGSGLPVGIGSIGSLFHSGAILSFMFALNSAFSILCHPFSSFFIIIPLVLTGSRLLGRGNCDEQGLQTGLWRHECESFATPHTILHSLSHLSWRVRHPRHIWSFSKQRRSWKTYIDAGVQRWVSFANTCWIRWAAGSYCAGMHRWCGEIANNWHEWKSLNMSCTIENSDSDFKIWSTRHDAICCRVPVRRVAQLLVDHGGQCLKGLLIEYDWMGEDERRAFQKDKRKIEEFVPLFKQWVCSAKPFASTPTWCYLKISLTDSCHSLTGSLGFLAWATSRGLHSWIWFSWLCCLEFDGSGITFDCPKLNITQFGLKVSCWPRTFTRLVFQNWDELSTDSHLLELIWRM